MLLPLPTPAEMAAWDKATIDEFGIPGFTLMEIASRECLGAVEEEFGDLDGATVHVFAGPGNNGGDAFALARHMADRGALITIYHTLPKKQYRAESRQNLVLAQKMGIEMVHLPRIDAMTIPQPDLIVDGLLGTGFSDDLRPEMLEYVRTINRLGERCFVFAIDIPSGLSGLTGKPQPDAVEADCTATFEAAKLGMILPRARRFVGELHVCPIGIPLDIQEQKPPRRQLLTGDIMSEVPCPTEAMHKGTAGHLLILGGSEGLTGAPHLAAIGALRAGAGMVTVACPEAFVPQVIAGDPDVMTLGLPGSQWNAGAFEALRPYLSRFNAVVIGPGLGRRPETLDFLQACLSRCPLPTVLDADALYHAAQGSLLDLVPNGAVITPHPGEMARLVNRSTDMVQENRIDIAEDFIADRSHILVLKGAGTIIADNETTCISPFSAPNLSVAGSGDVLAGIIGALLARKVPKMLAACLGVYWHGMAGVLLAEDYPLRGNLASEIANNLPNAAKEFKTC